MGVDKLHQYDVELMKLHREVAQIMAFSKDVQLLKHIKQLLLKSEKETLEKYFKPMSEEEYLTAIRESQKDYEEGRVSSIEEVIKESENW